MVGSVPSVEWFVEKATADRNLGSTTLALVLKLDAGAVIPSSNPIIYQDTTTNIQKPNTNALNLILLRFTPTCGGKPELQPARGTTAFTPTCVGKTSAAVGLGLRVHPHVCGENDKNVGGDWSRGSPPRVWGKRGYAKIHRARIRFTPTCVGKTFAGFQGNCTGPPPRVWGKLDAPRQRTLLLHQFTPTCVGKTAAYLLRPDVAVHPHVCGENIADFPPNGPRRSVHPHVCGENSVHPS